MKRIALKNIGTQSAVEQWTSVRCFFSGRRLKSPVQIIPVILFLVLFALAAIMLAGCYSGKYGDEIDPCDPDVPVVLNGDTIPEERIWRSDSGCVIVIDLYSMSISDSNYLSGIYAWSTTLEYLCLVDNNLTSIDLSPLASCVNLRWLYLSGNQLTSIDLSPLASCTNLRSLEFFDNQLTSIDLSPLASCADLLRLYLNGNQLTSIDLTPLWDLDSLALWLDNNDLDSASCAHVCDFIDEHPDCWVRTDCDCP